MTALRFFKAKCTPKDDFHTSDDEPAVSGLIPGNNKAAPYLTSFPQKELQKA